MTTEVASRWPIDLEACVLVGHSLGGLAVLHALYAAPDHYCGYVAVSPALYWHGHAITTPEARFMARLATGQTMPRVFLAAGGDEDVPRAVAGSEDDEARRRDAIAHARIQAGTVALAGRLREAAGSNAYRVLCRVPPGETHVSVFPAVLPAALRHVLPASGDAHV